MRAPRWPFLAALGALLVLLAVGYGLPPLIQTINDRGSAAVLEAEYGAAVQAIAAVPRPAALRPCPGSDQGPVALICWEGDVSPVRAAGLIRDSLKKTGAADISARCANLPRLGDMCIVQARVQGQDFGVNIGPSLDGHDGVFVSGGAGSAAMLTSLPRAASPVPIPAQ